MKLTKKLGLVAVMAGVMALLLVSGFGGGANATVPADPTSCYCTQPALTLTLGNAYWGSLADYNSRTLSVDYDIHNASTNYANAKNLQVTGTANSGGVIMSSAGRTINMVPAGECELLTLKYTVPAGVSRFSTRVQATTSDQCGNSYSYGGATP